MKLTVVLPVVLIMTVLVLSGCTGDSGDDDNNNGDGGDSVAPPLSEVTIILEAVWKTGNTLCFCNSFIDFEKLPNYAYYKIDGIRQPADENSYYTLDIGALIFPTFKRKYDYPDIECFSTSETLIIPEGTGGTGTQHEFEICWTHDSSAFLNDTDKITCKSLIFTAREFAEQCPGPAAQ